MCLSVVARIEKKVSETGAIVELRNVRKTINLGLLSGVVSVDDWVLIHTGFAISKIDEEKALEILKAYELTDELDVQVLNLGK